MQNSKVYLKERNLYPRISFKDKKPHTIELVNDKADSMKDERGAVKEGIKYLVKEDGELKTFFTASPSLISFLSTCEPGDIVSIEMKAKNIGGSLKTVYSMSKSGEATAEDEDTEAVIQVD